MLHFPAWKIAIVVAVCAISVALALPNLFSRSSVEGLPDWVPHNQVNLGLDLQGGSHLLLEVDIDLVFRERLETLVEEVRLELRGDRIGYRGLGVNGTAVEFTLTDPATTDQALALLVEEAAGSIGITSGGGGGGGFGLGMGGAGGAAGPEFELSDLGDGRISMQLSEAGMNARRVSAVTQSLEVVRRRIDELGTREPTIQRQGDDRILVQVPGEKNPENIKNLLGKTARLTFQMVDETASVVDAQRGQMPPGTELLPSDDIDGRGQSIDYVIRKKVEVSGENLVDAQPSFDQRSNEPVVSLRFDTIGARRFGEITSNNVGKRFAIVLDGKVISAPNIREPITGGSGIISGTFTVESANELSILLRAGALPAPLTILEERSVGPDLGADSIRAGKIASILALVLVAVFMIVYYGLFGIVANIALFTNLILITAGLSVLQATLTLPGIAGIVLTIGMAVDANVLIFERIREEVRLGKTPLNAIDNGYRQAMRTIIDANVTTLIAAVILFEFGSGPIKGFAVTLAIGIVTSMFTAITLTRLFVIMWYRRTRPAALPV